MQWRSWFCDVLCISQGVNLDQQITKQHLFCWIHGVHGQMPKFADEIQHFFDHPKSRLDPRRVHRLQVIGSNVGSRVSAAINGQFSRTRVANSWKWQGWTAELNQVGQHGQQSRWRYRWELPSNKAEDPTRLGTPQWVEASMNVYGKWSAATASVTRKNSSNSQRIGAQIRSLGVVPAGFV